MKTQVSRYAFIHAKMHGIMAKSCFDERLRFLLKMTSLLELSNALFSGAGSSGAFSGGGEGGSDRELVHDVQRKFEKSIVKTLVRLLSFFREPPPLLVHVLREYDYRNFLALVRGKNSGVQTAGLWDTGKYALLPPDAGENFPASLANTPFEKYAALSGVKPLSEIEFEVDKQYYEELAACALALPSGEASRVRPLLEAEIVLRNLVWALRLRFYFRMTYEEAQGLLFPLDFPAAARGARLVFELPLDDAGAWTHLPCGEIFTAQRDGLIDPEAIEGRASTYLYKKTRRLFYTAPFTLASAYAFFRIKLYEARLVISLSEGIRMGISSGELASLMGAA